MFHRNRRIPAHEIRDVFLRNSTGALMVETDRREIEITALGTILERRAIVDRYGRKEALHEVPHALGWTESSASGGVVIRHRNSRSAWHLRRGAMTIVSRFLGRVRERPVDPGTIELEVSNDSDGDEWTTLRATSNGKKIVVYRTMNNSRTTIRLARRIEKATGWHISIPHTLHGEARMV
jgi:hypothetical protein